MHVNAKITPADYPDLLAAVKAGVPQRELARRYDCARSLVARHVAKAKRARELSGHAQDADLGLTVEPQNGSMREILEARIRDPRTSARDLASLTNSLAKLDEPPPLPPGQEVPWPPGAQAAVVYFSKEIPAPEVIHREDCFVLFREQAKDDAGKDAGYVLVFPLPPDLRDEPDEEPSDA